jgi:hypothetical protein
MITGAAFADYPVLSSGRQRRQPEERQGKAPTSKETKTLASLVGMVTHILIAIEPSPVLLLARPKSHYLISLTTYHSKE